MKKLISIIVISVTAVATAIAAPKIQNRLAISEIEKEQQEVVEQAKNEVQKSALLDVQFICQAPLQTEKNWELHEESCEEAALLMTYLYKKNKIITKEEANEEILKMIAWQEKEMNGHFDLYADQMKQFITGYYSLNDDQVKIHTEMNIPKLKALINQGEPVIVPITGEILQNPFYPYPGYHMLVATGYTEDKIITNDNGTRRGEDFSYDQKIFEEAMQDAGGEVITLSL